MSTALDPLTDGLVSTINAFGVLDAGVGGFESEEDWAICALDVEALAGSMLGLASPPRSTTACSGGYAAGGVCLGVKGSVKKRLSANIRSIIC